MSANSFKGAVPKATAPVKAPEADEPKQRGDERGMIRATFYLPVPVYEQFRDLAYAKRKTQQDLFREAANMLFAREGLRMFDELWQKKK